MFLPINKVYAHKKTKYGDISIVDIDTMRKTLVLDNEMQCNQYDYINYHNNLIFAHKAKPNERAVILGSGEGVSLDLVLRCGYEKVTAIDINKDAIELYKVHLKDWNHGAYEKTDEYEMIYGCALEYLKDQPDESIEYLVVDFDSESLKKLSSEIMKHAYRTLKPDGVCSCQDGNKFFPSLTIYQAMKHFKKDPKQTISNSWRFTHFIK